MDVLCKNKWNSILYELNNFGCKIEFIQCKTRDDLLIRKIMRVDDYLAEIRDLVHEHENNLHLLFNYSRKKLKNEILIY